jgi:hypothetical protein
MKITTNLSKHSSTAPSRVMGKEEGMETTLLKKNSIQDSVRNEKNGYPVPDLNKTMINVTK